MPQLFFYSLVVVVLISACDSTTPSPPPSNELTYQQLQLVTNDRLERLTKELNFIHGTRVRLLFQGIKGLQVQDSRVYPDLSLCVKNTAGDTLLYQASALEEAVVEQGLPAQKVALETGFLAVFSLEQEAAYTLQVTIKDTKGTGQLVYEVPFWMQANNLLEVKTKELTYQEVYLWDNTAQHGVTERRVYKDHEYILFFVGVQGLTVNNDLVYPSLSIDLVDRTGERVVAVPNFIPQLTQQGVEATKIQDHQLYVPFQFYNGDLKNPYQFRAVLGEPSSSKQLEITSHFEIL